MGVPTRWMYYGYGRHIFRFDKRTGHISCSCGQVNTRVSGQQAVPVSERHVRYATRSLGSLMINVLDD